jgi:hypothetical protein
LERPVAISYFEDPKKMRTASNLNIEIGIGTIAKGCTGGPALDSPL